VERIIYGRRNKRFVEGKKPYFDVGLNCTTRQSGLMQDCVEEDSLQFSSPGFCQVVRHMPHEWRDPVEEFPSRAISVQDMTTLPGIIFAAKVIHYS
jgi:hypothetical protein